ncbi:MAG: TIR domain-containing protein [Chloroflexi bacterium]|nr:TIR domain-containing protein [Chloroflexota bacterium]
MMPKRIFISYARREGMDYAAALYDRLEARKYKPWRDIRNINPHADFSVEIEQAIEDSDIVVVVLTPDVKQNPTSFVRREILHAQATKKPILPLRMPGYNQAVPILINHLTYIPFDDFERGFEALIRQIENNPTFLPPQLPPDSFRSYVVKLRDSVVEQLRQAIPVGDQLIRVRHITRANLVSQPLSLAYEDTDDEEGFLDRRDRERKLSNNVTVLDVLNDPTYEQRVLVVGDPGAGKTTMLLAFTREMVNRRLTDPEASLPIYAPIRLWQPGQTLIQFLAGVTGIAAKDVESLLDSKSVILILDGLDELPRRYEQDERVLFMRMISDFKELPILRETPTIVTCRAQDYEDIIKAADGERIALNGAVALLRLDREQIISYLADYPHLQAIIHDNPDLTQMIRTPLILSIVVAAFKDAEAAELKTLLARNQAAYVFYDKLFQTYIQRMWEHERKRRRNRTMPYAVAEIYTLLGKAITYDIGESISQAADERERALSLDKDPETLSEYITSFLRLFDVLFSPEKHFKDSYDPNVIRYESFLQVLGADRVTEFLNLVGRDQLNILSGDLENGYRFFHPLLQDHIAVAYMGQSVNQASGTNDLITAVSTLITVSDHGFNDRVRPLLDDADPGKSATAALALAIMGDKTVSGTFIKSLRPENEKVAQIGLLGLFLLSDREVVAQARSHLMRLIKYDGVMGARESDEENRILSGILLSWVLDWGTALDLGWTAATKEHEPTRKAILVALILGGMYTAVEKVSPDLAKLIEGGISGLIEKHGRRLVARGRSLKQPAPQLPSGGRIQ